MRLIDLVAWAKTCMLLAAATPPRGLERARALAELRRAVDEPRRLVDEILQSAQTLPQALLVDLRVSEMAISKLVAGAVLRRETKHPPPPRRPTEPSPPRDADTAEPPPSAAAEPSPPRDAAPSPHPEST